MRPEEFLLVSFRDEGGNFLHGHENLLFARVREALLHGLTVAGRRFSFLAASSSQLRSQQCWMTSGDREAIWGWMGDFSGISTPSKYLSQVASSSQTKQWGMWQVSPV